MSTTAFHVAVALALALTTALLAAETPGTLGTAGTPADEGGEPIPQIEVALLGPPERVKGLAWPRQEDGGGATLTAVDAPRTVIVNLPSGATIGHFSRVTSLVQDRGAITDVTIAPHEGTLPYQEAISLLERLLGEWDAELTNVSKLRVKRWKSQGDVPPNPLLRRTAGARVTGEEKVKLFFRLRPTEGGWFLSVNIAATAEARRTLSDSSVEK